MLTFKDDKEFLEWWENAQAAARGVKGQLERTFGVPMCYYEGYQWFTQEQALTTLQRLKTDLSPDSNRLRVTMNLTARYVQKAAVATSPQEIQVDVFPPDRDAGPQSAVLAQLYEDTLNLFIDQTRYASVRADANFGRSVCGTYGVGLSLRGVARQLAGEQAPVQDTELRTFKFLPLKLTLDPYCEALDLDEHDYVGYSDVWSERKIREVLGPMLDARGIELNPNELQTIGQLCPFELSVNALSQNRLYARYRHQSATKGAVVHQVHIKDDNGRFGTMLVMLELPREGRIILNPEHRESPFGGSGLPLMLLHGHRRADSIWSIGDATMLRDFQDQYNLVKTQQGRMQQKHAGWQWKVDMSSMGKNATIEGVAQRFSNTVSGIVPWYSGGRDKPGHAPELVQYPWPGSQLFELSQEYDTAMRDQIHRAGVNFGEVKSHVPAAVDSQAREEADQVLGMRVHEDKIRDERLLTVMLGTIIKQVQAGSPGTLGMLRRNQFTDDDLAMLYQSDPNFPACSVKVRESSIRYRSYSQKRQDLEGALVNKALTPKEYRSQLVQYDTPLTQEDQVFASGAQKAALRVLLGEEWMALPLGDRSDEYIRAFRMALLDRIAQRDPAASQRVSRAVQSQKMAMLQEAAMEQAALQPPAPPGAGQPGDEGAAAGAEGQSFDQVVSAIESQGQPQGQVAV